MISDRLMLKSLQTLYRFSLCVSIQVRSVGSVPRKAQKHINLNIYGKVGVQTERMHNVKRMPELFVFGITLKKVLRFT